MKFKLVLVEVELISGDSNLTATVNLQTEMKKNHVVVFFSLEIHPDFVILGKSMGNGFPVAALVTKREITDKFEHDGIEYFNTYGGNPVSCRAAIAVLEVIENEKLQENAHKVGLHFLEKLKKIAENHEIIGDVRGRGLFLGIEIVRDRNKRIPDAEVAHEIRSK